MFTYSNRLQPAVQNILQRVVRFFHPRSSCTSHILADVFSERKSLVKPVTQQKTCNYIKLFGSYTRHCTARWRIYRRTFTSENKIKCVVHDDLGWKKQTTRYILPCHWLYEWFSQFHSCGTYSVLSRSPSIVTEFIIIDIFDNDPESWCKRLCYIWWIFMLHSFGTRWSSQLLGSTVL